MLPRLILAKRKERRHASWVPETGGTVATPPGSFTVVTGPSANPLLAEFLSTRGPISLSAPFTEDPTSDLLSGIGIFGDSENGPWFNVRFVQQQWQTTELFTAEDPSPAQWQVVQRHLTPATGQIQLLPPGAGSFEVKQVVSGATVLSGSAPSTDPIMVVLPGSGLAPGLLHFVVGSGFGDSAEFLPLRHWGKPFITGTSMVDLTPITISGESRVDTADFTLLCAANRREPEPSGVEQMDVYLAINVLPGSGAPPISVVGDEAVLSPLAVFGPVSHEFENGHPLSVSAHFDQPIPDDNTLIGTTFLWQFVTVAPAGVTGEVSLSDVVGGRSDGLSEAVRGSTAELEWWAPPAASRGHAGREALRCLQGAKAYRVRDSCVAAPDQEASPLIQEKGESGHEDARSLVARRGRRIRDCAPLFPARPARIGARTGVRCLQHPGRRHSS